MNRWPVIYSSAMWFSAQSLKSRKVFVLSRPLMHTRLTESWYLATSVGTSNVVA